MQNKYKDKGGGFKSFKQYPYQGYWTDPRPTTMKNTAFSDKLKSKASSQKKSMGGTKKAGKVTSDGIKKPKHRSPAKITRPKNKRTSAGDVSGIVDYLSTKDLKKLKNRKH